ncbi:MAG TPA: ABC transporter ATP-binding protein [Firmicutes bacterium]|nr:ABC transporter ATP-binding protein [Bacillota bacterium]
MLKVEGVSTFYGNIQALKQIDLEVKAGEIVTLIGANGVGKTTTLKTISGLIRPAEGKISFNDQDITAEPPHRIVEMGISHVPEGRCIFPRLNLRENLEMGAYIRQDNDQIEKDIDQVFETFPQLKNRKNQVAGTLSGGEQQMLAIGRALMSKPKLLLLDEPSMGLAPMVVVEIFNIIEEINRQGTTILLVEQNAQLALKTAHRGYVMETGRVVMHDCTEALLSNDQVRQTYLGEEH